MLRFDDNDYKSDNTPTLSQTIFGNITKFNHEEYQYLQLIENILDNGEFIQ